MFRRWAHNKPAFEFKETQEIAPEPEPDVTEASIIALHDLYAPHLPQDWSVLRIFFKFDADSSQSFADYINGDGAPKKFSRPLEDRKVSTLETLCTDLAIRSNIGPGVATHIKVEINNYGRYKCGLGYGPIDWDKMWPDDLTAEPYSYNERGSVF